MQKGVNLPVSLVSLVAGSMQSSLLQPLCGRQDQVPWEHKEITVMGRQVMQPRMVAYMADDTSMHYTYSHTTLTPHPWLPAVAAIKVSRCFLL